MQSISKNYPKALVTGASSGLGKAFADMLLAEGVEVWGTSRDASRIEKREGLHALSLDLADPQSVQSFMRDNVEILDQVDLFINNAGAGVFSSFFEMHPQDIGEQLKVLMHGPIALCHRVLPSMLSREKGAIVNVASLAADFPLPWFSLYSACKAGLSQFSRALAIELVGTDVAIIDLQPGDFKTDFNRAAKKPDHMDEDEQKLWKRIEYTFTHGPEPEKAARDLRKALMKGKSSVVVTGNFFQATVAPLAARLVPWSVTSWCVRKYFGL